MFRSVADCVLSRMRSFADVHRLAGPRCSLPVPEGGSPLDSFVVPSRVWEGDFAGWLRDSMAARRVSARMLAMRAGVDHTTISRLASGRREPTLRTAVALFRVLTSEPIQFQIASSEHEELTLEVG